MEDTRNTCDVEREKNAYTEAQALVIWIKRFHPTTKSQAGLNLLGFEKLNDQRHGPEIEGLAQKRGTAAWGVNAKYLCKNYSGKETFKFDLIAFLI